MTPKSRQPEHLSHQASRGSGFGPGQPSRTSIVVAALRAYGAREPDPSVRNPDWLAERLLGPAQLQLITEHPIGGALHQAQQPGPPPPRAAGIGGPRLKARRFVADAP